MKKKIYCSFFLIISFFACQNKKELLTKKWNVVETEVSGQKLSGDLVYGFYFELKPDGSYILEGMSTEKGKWSLSGNGDSIITINQKGRRAGYYIDKISEKELVLSDKFLEIVNVTKFESTQE